jgi:hypothetical protein
MVTMEKLRDKSLDSLVGATPGDAVGARGYSDCDLTSGIAVGGRSPGGK